MFMETSRNTKTEELFGKGGSAVKLKSVFYELGFKFKLALASMLYISSSKTLPYLPERNSLST